MSKIAIKTANPGCGNGDDETTEGHGVEDDLTFEGELLEGEDLSGELLDVGDDTSGLAAAFHNNTPATIVTTHMQKLNNRATFSTDHGSM